jgi:hypothetical protein
MNDFFRRFGPEATAPAGDYAKGGGAALATGFLDASAALDFADLVGRARSDWTTAFGGAQYSLGIAWYTHLEEGKAGDYFAAASTSDATVERAVPGLQRCLTSAIERAVQGPVSRRRGFAGPGIHVFPAGGEAARRGGDVHFDDEGLTPAELESNAPALTFVLVLRPADSGGGLRLWTARLGDGDPVALGKAPFDVVPYSAGDLLIMDSRRLHQIEPFGGTTDRITATCHAVQAPDGRWLVWF